MSIAQNGRSIREVRYVDEAGHDWRIMLAYLGERVVWDGRISETRNIPRAVSTSAGFPPDAHADASTAIPAALSYAEAKPVSVTAGVGIAAPCAVSVSEGVIPVLHSNHVLDIPVAQSMSEAYAPTIATLYGVMVPCAVSTSQGYVPGLFADSSVTIPRAMSYSEALPPEVGSYVQVAIPNAVSTSQAHVPELVSGSVLINVPRALSTSQGHSAVVRAASMIEPPVAVSTSQAYAPEVKAATVLRQRMDKSGGNFNGGFDSWKLVTGWTAQPGTPTVVTGDRMQIVGLGNVTANLSFNVRTSFSAGVEVRITKNGSAVWTSVKYTTSGVRTGGTSLVVADGDLIGVECRVDNDLGVGLSTANTFLELTV